MVESGQFVFFPSQCPGVGVCFCFNVFEFPSEQKVRYLLPNQMFFTLGYSCLHGQQALVRVRDKAYRKNCVTNPQEKSNLSGIFKIPKNDLKGPSGIDKPFCQYDPRRWQSCFLRGDLWSSKEALRTQGQESFQSFYHLFNNILNIKTSFMKAPYLINKC